MGLRNPQMIKNFWRIAERYRVTVGGAVPTIMSALLDRPVDGDLSSLRINISGSAAAPVAVVEQYEAHTGRTVHEIYGMTECGATVSVNPPGARVIGSVGFRIPYIRTAVRRLNSDGSLGEQCLPGEIGALTISGPTVTPGYRNLKDNDDAILRGHLNSGDLAYTDEDGRIYIAGRAKDLIIRSGHNIDQRLIEQVLERHPAVALVAAVGQPDIYAGELPVCYVSLKSGAHVTPEQPRAFAEPRISERPAWPKQYYPVDQLPTTAVGKVFKPTLRADATRRVVKDAIAKRSIPTKPWFPRCPAESGE
jgi:fatty-acyl-CoA synthase